MTDTRNDGIRGEDAAVAFLQSKGYHIIERNYFFGQGEIDIIAKENDTLVFVEVKSRRSQEFCEPEDAVSAKKAGFVRRTAEGYLLQHRLDGVDCRFDIVAVDFCCHPKEIRHIPDAF